MNRAGRAHIGCRAGLVESVLAAVCDNRPEGATPCLNLLVDSVWHVFSGYDRDFLTASHQEMALAAHSVLNLVPLVHLFRVGTHPLFCLCEALRWVGCFLMGRRVGDGGQVTTTKARMSAVADHLFELVSAQRKKETSLLPLAAFFQVRSGVRVGSLVRALACL